MKLRVRTTTTYISIGLFVAGAFAVAAIFGLYSILASKTQAQSEVTSGRIITVHDRGQTVSFITDKTKLKDALDAVNIEVNEQDAVEPSLDEALVASDYQVNIYRARPVTIIDGPLQQTVVTPYQSADRIVKGAGITLFKEDIASLARSTDIISSGAGLQLVIDRATPLELTLYGSETAIRTQAETVGAMLKEKSISLGESDRVSPALESKISEAMQVRVWREGKQTVTAEESVEFKVQQIRDADQPVGYSAVQTPGVAGARTVTYEVEIIDGAEVSRTEIASITTLEPVTQVEVVGIKSNGIPYTGGGSKTEWLIASGIPQEQWGYVDFIVSRESGWKPCAFYPSRNDCSASPRTACGLAQSLPCGKQSKYGHWTDPVANLKWQYDYVSGRYGGYEQAYAFWSKNKWY